MLVSFGCDGLMYSRSFIEEFDWETYNDRNIIENIQRFKRISLYVRRSQVIVGGGMRFHLFFVRYYIKLYTIFNDSCMNQLDALLRMWF
jgi:hypothetical protein